MTSLSIYVESDKFSSAFGKYTYYYNTQNGVDTDSPFEGIYKTLPDKIKLMTAHFDPDMLGLVVNSLIAEGYELYYKVSKDGWIDGYIIYFRISKENKAKLKHKVRNMK